MNRFARILGSSAAIVLALPAIAVGSSPRSQLRGFVCQRAVEPVLRAMSVTSVMRPVGRTQAMAIRFELLSRPRGAAAFTPLTASGTDLGRWISPPDRTLGRRPGDVWILNKQVVDLPAPAAYRLRVHFRWSGAHHHVLAGVTKTTAICVQRELRPDLLVRRISAPAPNAENTADFYTVTVANNGASPAGQFDVQLSDPGHPPVSRSLAGLAPHASRTVTLRGPLCSAAAPPTVTVDPPPYAVDDFYRKNNVATVSCTTATTPF